jgi:hypothetical protein
MQPVDEGRIRAVRAQSLVDLDKDVLSAILGGGLTAKRAEADIEDGAVMAFDQPPEGVIVTGEAGRNELALLDLARRRNGLA